MYCRHFYTVKIISVICLAGWLVSCDFRVVRDPEVLVMNIEADPTLLNPIIATDAYASQINTFIFERLIKFNNSTLAIEPHLAHSWEISEDGLSYTFHIKPQARWSDNVPLRADDVVYSFQKIMDPEVDAPHLRNYYSQIREIKKLDDLTIRCVYNEPYFKAIEICGAIPILPKHLFDNGEDFNTHSLNRHPIGSGPFRFVRWRANREIVLERNPNYWGTPPHLKGVVFRLISDKAAMLQLLKKEELDDGNLRAIQWERQTDSQNFLERFKKIKYYPPSVGFVGWNLRKPFFSDKRIRQALTMLVDRRQILEKLYFGNGIVVSSDAYYFGPSYNHDLEPLSYDPEKARELLDASGWIDHDGDGIRDMDGVPFQFVLSFPTGSPTGTRLGGIMRENFLKNGILMDIRGLEWSVFIKGLMDRSFDAALLAWATPVETDPYQAWHSSQAEKGSNFVGFKNREADQLIGAGRHEIDPVRRQKLFHRLHGIIHDQQPCLFLTLQPTLEVLHRRFTDVTEYKLGVDPMEWRVQPWATLYQ